MFGKSGVLFEGLVQVSEWFTGIVIHLTTCYWYPLRIHGNGLDSVRAS